MEAPRLENISFAGHIRTALRVLGVAALFGCLQQPAESPDAGSVPASHSGQRLYASYCADCHGAEGRGDGPRAASLTRAPPDLTGIANRNGGLFIADAVAAYVDGRAHVEAHGPTDMPPWGRSLDDRNQALREELKLTPAWISEIVAYLETLQQSRP
jgi:mono/diheme cytochrome c family protein